MTVGAVCRRCGGTDDLRDRGMAPGMTYCRFCREYLTAADQRGIVADALGRVLAAAGVTDPHSPLTGPRLLCAAEDYIAGRSKVCQDALRTAVVGSATRPIRKEPAKVKTLRCAICGEVWGEGPRLTELRQKAHRYGGWRYFSRGSYCPKCWRARCSATYLTAL